MKPDSLDYTLAAALAGVFLVAFLKSAFGLPYAAWYVFGSLAGASGLAILITDPASARRLVNAATVVGPLVGVLLLASLVRRQIVVEDALNLGILVALFTLGTLVRSAKAVAVFFGLIAAAAICTTLILARPEMFEGVVSNPGAFARNHLNPGAVLATGFVAAVAGTTAAVIGWRRVWYGLAGLIPVAVIGLGLVVNRGRGAVLWTFLGSVLSVAIVLVPRLWRRARYGGAEVVRSRIIAASLAGILSLSVVVFFTAPATGGSSGAAALRETFVAVFEATGSENDDSPLIWRLISAGDPARQWRMEESAEAIGAAPVFGGGIGGYRALRADYAHNVVLQVGVDGGLLAVAALLWFFLVPIVRLSRSLTQRVSPTMAAALGGALTAALLFQTSFNFYTAPILFVSFGIALSLVPHTAQEPDIHESDS